MIKSSILVACLLLSVSAAPEPKPQFDPTDAQYSSVYAPEQTVVRVAQAPRAFSKTTVSQSPLYAGALPAVAGIAPINSYGRAAAIVPQAPIVSSYGIDEVAQHGQIAVINGRQAQFLNGQWSYMTAAAAPAISSWNSGWSTGVPAAPAYQTVTSEVVGARPIAALRPALAAPAYQSTKTVEYAAARPAIAVSAPAYQSVKSVEYAAPRPVAIARPALAAHAHQSTKTVEYARPLAVARPAIALPAPTYQSTKTVEYAGARPAIPLPAPALQSVNSYTQTVARPAVVDSKWYTKTNRQLVQPFYAQAPQVTEIDTVTKQLAPNPTVEIEANDWRRSSSKK